MTTEEAVGLNIQLNAGAQESFVKCLEPFPAFIGGFGSGKTAAGCIKAFFYTLQNPGAHGCITEPVSGMLADPLMEAWRKLWGDFEGSLWVEVGRLGPNWRLEFPSLKSHILLRSAETPGRLIGFEVAWAWMDEAAESEGGSQELAFLNLVSRTRQKGFRHWLGITTTSAGRDWLWRDWEEHRKDGHVLFRASSFENPHRDVGAVERMAKLYGKDTPRYRQRIMAEFAELEGLVLPTFDPRTMIAPWPDDSVFLRSVAGIDFAPESPTAIVEVSVDASRRPWLREWLYEWQCDDDTLLKGCRAAMRAGVTLFLGDPSAKARIHFLNMKGIPTYKARSNQINDRVGAWSGPIAERRLMVAETSSFLKREITGLTWAKSRGREMASNRFAPNAPDHAFDAGAYGLQEIGEMILDWKEPTISEW